MRVCLVTNLNGKGLQVDAELLRDWLTEHDHAVDTIQYDQPMPTDAYDLAICLEVIGLPNAKTLWYLANPEWLLPSYTRQIQRSFQKVLAKTRDAEKVLRERFSNVEYVGFLCRDKLDPSIERERKFLHLGGGSGFRNTPAVIEAWRSYRYWNDSTMAPLTVVSNSTTVIHEPTPGITFIKRASDEEITELQNSHLFHVMPSAYEGFGHAIHEAQSVGAILLTTGEGPMAELKAPFEVPPIRRKKNNLAVLCEVSPQSVREMVPKMLAQPNHVIARMQLEARARFERGNAEFSERFSGLLKARMAPSTPRARLAILGNFEPPHSTENDLLWTLRDMGYEVTSFQENKDTTDEILEECKRLRIRLLIYVATHGWETPGTFSLEALFSRLGVFGIKMAGFHLDRYWGLNALDKREDRIGVHPFWHIPVFTADGGNQERFKERGVTHYWLPPGIAKRHCFPGEYRQEYACEVGFIGAESYHPEHSFRGGLIRFLRDAYGERFRLFQGIRGDNLNAAYASIKVAVGDSCFGGSDYYWSDRVPETLGRGGFLIHPETKGLRIPGLVTFEPGNLAELQDKIDYYLDHQDDRAAYIKAASGWVRENETYSNRMRKLLDVMEIA
jgi:Glycosyl transferases group 1